LNATTTTTGILLFSRSLTPITATHHAALDKIKFKKTHFRHSDNKAHACTHACMHTRTHAHTTVLQLSVDFFRDNPGESLPEETFPHSHLSWSSVIPYLLPQFIMIHGILPVQFMCLTVFFHNPSPSFLWSTS